MNLAFIQWTVFFFFCWIDGQPLSGRQARSRRGPPVFPRQSSDCFSTTVSGSAAASRSPASLSCVSFRVTSCGGSNGSRGVRGRAGGPYRVCANCKFLIPLQIRVSSRRCCETRWQIAVHADDTSLCDARVWKWSSAGFQDSQLIFG